MAQQDPNDPQYYPKSRSAMRSMYGSRKIDARTRFSDADSTPSAREARQRGYVDDTPSGREREMRRQGKSQKRIDELQDDVMRDRFGPRTTQEDFITPPLAPVRPMSPMSPMARMAPPPAAPPLDIFGEIRNAHAQGFQSANWQIPGGGSVGFSLAPTTPPDQNAVATQLSSIPMPKSLFSGFGQQKRPSVLSSASKWLAPV
jgi:hypothetical protein